MGVKKSTKELDDFKMKAMKAYAKANNISIPIFISEHLSHELIGVAIKSSTDYKGEPYFTFGRVYHIFGDQCGYYQQGCYSTHNEKEAFMEAFKFFGIK